jgi:hypothetical protein
LRGCILSSLLEWCFVDVFYFLTMENDFKRDVGVALRQASLTNKWANLESRSGLYVRVDKLVG